VSRPPISVIVPTRDRPEQLAGCLATTTAALGPGDELIVVDSASRDAAAVAAVATAAGARIVRSERSGASVARNLGWRAATNDRIGFLDDDVRVERSWAAAMAAALEVPGTHWVTGRVGIRSDDVDSGLPVALMVDPEPKVFDGSTGEHPGHSANLGVTRAAMERIDGFDEHLGPGRPFIAEDVDLFDRLLGAGLSGRYDPTVRATHEQWRTRRERVRLDWDYGKGTGARLAKLVRVDRRRARLVQRVAIVDWALGSLVRDLRARHARLVATDVVRLVGIGVGFGRALVIPVRGGHLRPRRDRYAPDAMSR
jgi:glycosyltransferase involved in cell wall biosynthesis